MVGEIASLKKADPWALSLSPVWNWIRDHPGALVIGALFLAALLATPTHRERPPADLTAEDVPLFV